MVIAATVGPPMVVVAGLRRAAPTEPATPAPPSEARKARRFGVSEQRTLPGRRLPAKHAQRLQPVRATMGSDPIVASAGARSRCSAGDGGAAAAEAAVAERRPVERRDL